MNKLDDFILVLRGEPRIHHHPGMYNGGVLFSSKILEKHHGKVELADLDELVIELDLNYMPRQLFVFVNARLFSGIEKLFVKEDKFVIGNGKMRGEGWLSVMLGPRTLHITTTDNLEKIVGK